MAEFLEVIETIRANEASVEKLFGGEGRSVRGGRLRQTPGYTAHLAEAAKFTAEIYEGQRPLYQFKEAMTTSDFPLLFGDILDRQLLANYLETPAVWQNFVKRSTVRDFRTVNRYAVSGAEAQLAVVAEQAPYPLAALGEARYQYAVAKYGRKLAFSWEAMINDDLGALRDVPARLGRAARRTEQRFVTTLYVDANGPHASFYTVGNTNIITSNPVLSIAAFQTAMTVLSAQRDSDGEPIAIDMVELVVPPALEVVANNILNATQLWLTAAGGVTGEQLVVANWMRNRTRINVDPYIPIIATTNGNTSWFLFANPNNGRPAIEMGFLTGHETPEIFIKESNAQRAGGGTVNPLDGDFDSDSVEYKVRHVLGGARMDPKMTVASNGTGA